MREDHLNSQQLGFFFKFKQSSNYIVYCKSEFDSFPEKEISKGDCFTITGEKRFLKF